MRMLTASLALALLTSLVAYAEYPADKFNLGFWKLTLPLDDNGDGKVDEIVFKVPGRNKIINLAEIEILSDGRADQQNACAPAVPPGRSLCQACDQHAACQQVKTDCHQSGDRRRHNPVPCN